ncbi:MAG: bifunctional (p)ppGpp synthetase/guanosine-3',5'-bis(diphosphate) 3'-pyrophosphohydrolase [Phycisphaerae bacterium]|nr:bifunctional (p)ppGpp synthetase/guanosine-3',5'-bis(diphosphate) 3'-pyrophosphohydrolase [Phycisphaerae bacterium]
MARRAESSGATGIELIQRAASFAARAHAGHTRADGTTPYFSHVVRVSMVLRHEYGCDDAQAVAAALLHDTIEDTPTDYDDIAEHFGDEVARIVAALTKSMILPEAQREIDYDARLAKADWRARLIKLADVYDNLSDMLQTGEKRKSLSKMIAKAGRAMALAKPDAKGHAETARAMAIVGALVKRARAQLPDL